MPDPFPPDEERPTNSRRPRFNDIRDDYDDDFAKIVTPRDRARRRLLVPALGIILVSALGVGLSASGIFALIATYFDGPSYAEELVIQSFLVMLLATCGYAFWFVGSGGAALVRLRRYKVALFAAWFVTALSLLGMYTFLLYAFGIWALIVLYSLKARWEFAGVVAPTPPTSPGDNSPRISGYGDVRDDFDDQFGQVVPPDVAIRRKVRIPAYVMMICGALGVLTLLIVSGYQILDFATSNRYIDDGELVVILLFTFTGMAYSAVMVFGGWCLLKQQRYRWAAIGAFFLTSLSVAGVLAVLFYPFGIWALILLFSDEVRAAFRKPSLTPNPEQSPARRTTTRVSILIRIPPRVFIIAGAIGIGIMLLLAGDVLFEAYVDEWKAFEVFWCVSLTILAICAFGALIGHGVYRKRRRPFEPVSPGSVPQ